MELKEEESFDRMVRCTYKEWVSYGCATKKVKLH
jgi:hypothetical protein